MSFIQILQDILYTIMNALLYPVILILIVSFGAVLYIFGSFLSEFFFRSRNKADIENIAYKISDDISGKEYQAAALKINQHLNSCSKESGQLRRFFFDLSREIKKGEKNLDIRIENVLQENETHTARSLDVTKAFVRLGPMVGLMGTLIPIGGALLSLAVGDMTQMSNKLVVAFSTTVVGLFIGGVAYVISIARERWYEADMKTMEFFSEIITRDLDVVSNGRY